MDTSLYSQWRCRLVEPALREGSTSTPPERLLQTIWFHQRLRRDKLRTVEGRPVRVLHPGFWSQEGGPDFQGAVIQLEDELPRTGDVEVDLAPGGWKSHGHDRNEHFKNVILHVVWKAGGKPGERPPTLELADALDASLGELDLWLGGDDPGNLPAELRGRCSAPLRELEDSATRELLHQAALVRLGAKASLFTARAREAGWEQALWLGLFGALGYKHNLWPFTQLAQTAATLPPITGKGAALVWQARLFGLAGLLPAELPKANLPARDVIRRLWEIWWRERDACHERALPRTLWRFHGLRPANHPLRRLALAAHWLAQGDLPARLEAWWSAETPGAQKPAGLLETLQAPPDEFWSRRCTWNSAATTRPQPLLGITRSNDLAVNVVIPWFYARATAGRHKAQQTRAESLYLAWPAGEDNAVLKLARQRLLGGRTGFKLATAADQQGLLQIVRDFCNRTNALCEHCRFPDLVRQFRAR